MRSRIVTQRRILAFLTEYIATHERFATSAIIAEGLGMHPVAVRRVLRVMYAKGMVLQNAPYAPYRPA